MELIERLIAEGKITLEEFNQMVAEEEERIKNDPASLYFGVDMLGSQLVEKDLIIMELQEENQRLGQMLVDMDLRLLQGGL